MCSSGLSAKRVRRLVKSRPSARVTIHHSPIGFASAEASKGGCAVLMGAMWPGSGRLPRNALALLADGRIQAVWIIRNPDKLAHLAARPTGPTPIGVFRAVQREHYGESMARQLAVAQAFGNLPA